MTIDLIIGPVSDLGPNDYSPSSGSDHFELVNEDPNDGDATFLQTLDGSREEWGLDLSAVPARAAVASLTIRSVQKRTTAGSQSYLVGLTRGGIDAAGALHSLGSGSTFATAEDDFTIDPDGAPLTLESLATCRIYHAQQTQPLGLPRPRLTECIAILTYSVVDRASGDPESLAPEATAEALAPSAAGAGMAPEATMASLAPAASGAALAPTSRPVVITPSADPSTRAPMADPAKLNTYSARPVALAPTADAVSLEPTAAPAALDPEGNPE